MSYIGIDNGVTGSVALVTERISGSLGETDNRLEPIPTRRELSYTKKKQHITRVDFPALVALFKELNSFDSPMVIIERPFVNPTGIKATVSAVRCLEAVLIAVESMGWPYQYVDSKQWQREMLPSGLKGTPQLKAASLDIGKRLFPALSVEIDKQKDADGLLIAEWARRSRL